MAATQNASTPLSLDHDLDVLPEAGRRMTVTQIAEHVDDLAGRLAAAKVRAGDRVAIYKTANFDVWVIASAVSRVGAVPVLLSPALDAATVGALLGRLDRPKVVTDERMFDALAGERLTDVADG
ncbi:AMP-binding protein [Micromonospora sp. M12]